MMVRRRVVDEKGSFIGEFILCIFLVYISYIFLCKYNNSYLYFVY